MLHELWTAPLYSTLKVEEIYLEEEKEEVKADNCIDEIYRSHPHQYNYLLNLSYSIMLTDSIVFSHQTFNVRNPPGPQ